ncbi:MAG TPA: hypothetical protein VFO78_05290 [Candidatus Limnocylindrales bacterium]|nr:hypothetical protein [Candidatus Limnocylindrales bacterium]
MVEIDRPGAGLPADRRSARHRAPTRARLGTAIALAIAVLSWAAAPALAADPGRGSGVPTRTSTTATTVTRTVDLSRTAAHVTQYTSYWCVPAAAQTMINIVTGRSDRTYATQSRLYTELQKANLYDYTTKGNDVRGWARVLSARLPAGMGYADVSFTSRGAAYGAIVDAMDRTKRPVGIVVGAGSHAWTVVGFTVRETTGSAPSRTILGFTVVGPLGSPRDPWPKKYLTVDQLASHFTRYHESQRAVVWEGKFVIVAPVAADGSVIIRR